MHMIHAALNDNKFMSPDNSIVIKAKLNIASPEEYLGSSDLKVYETFITGTLAWLKMNGFLGTEHASFQVEYLGTRLKGNDALEWDTSNVKWHEILKLGP